MTGSSVNSVGLAGGVAQGVSSGLFALCGFQISFRLHGGMISFLLQLDVYRYFFIWFISEGATLAPQLLLYCTGFPFAIFLHGYCSTALALFFGHVMLTCGRRRHQSINQR